jgi:hypothetical protein
MTDGAHREIDVDATLVEASVRVDGRPVLAGGPLVVIWRLRLLGAGPLYVALGGDRVAGRLAAFRFAATLEGSSLRFEDPAANQVDLGGPMGVQPVTPNGLDLEVLVNQFVTLEATRLALPLGGRGLLDLACHWDLLLGARPDAVFTAPARPTDLQLQVEVHRDDDALRALVRSQVEAVLRAEREDPDALARVAALRYPEADAIASSTGGDPDRLAWVRAALAS